MNTKQVIIVRKDLNMRRGKEIAQGAHASLAVFFNMMRDQNGGDIDTKSGKKYKCEFEHTSQAMHEWMQNGFTKITLTVNSEAELVDAYNLARQAGIPCSLIKDSGKTEFGGVPTLTTVAIGPASSEVIDKITGNLKLY
jgi:PTH2 family peptidyl-tRNA hydrolase